MHECCPKSCNACPATAAPQLECIGCSDPAQFAKKTDYQGMDLVKGGTQASTPAECCKKCEGMKQCECAADCRMLF